MPVSFDNVPKARTEYRRSYAWPKRAVTSRHVAQAHVATEVVEEDLSPVPPPQGFPFPQSEYQRSYIIPDTGHAARRVDVGDPGETRVVVQEITPTREHKDFENADIFHSKDEETTTTNRQPQFDNDEDDESNEPLHDDRGTDSSGSEDTNNQDDDSLRSLVEQPLQDFDRRSPVRDTFATETNDHFQHPSLWQTTAAADAIRQSVYSGDFSPRKQWPTTSLSRALAEVRERARAYKTRSRRSEISNRLARLSDQQVGLLERAGKYLDLLPQEKQASSVPNRGNKAYNSRAPPAVPDATFDNPAAWNPSKEHASTNYTAQHHAQIQHATPHRTGTARLAQV